MGRIMWWFASAREEVDYRDTPASYITNVQEEEPPVLRHLGQEQLQLWETLPLVGKVLFWERFRHLSLELHHITIKGVLNAFLGYFYHDNVPFLPTEAVLFMNEFGFQWIMDGTGPQIKGFYLLRYTTLTSLHQAWAHSAKVPLWWTLKG